MRPIAKSTLRAFWTKFPSSRDPLDTWYTRAEKSNWKNLADVRRDYPATDLVKSDRGDKLVFNIGGNKYRLVCRIEFGKPLMPILFVGTHAEYDRISVKDL